MTKFCEQYTGRGGFFLLRFKCIESVRLICLDPKCSC